MTSSVEPTDPVDRLILDESDGMSAARITVLDDPSGELTAAVAHRSPSAEVTVHCDSLVDERAVTDKCAELDVSVTVADDLETALHDAELVILRLPRSVDAMSEIAEAAARHGAPTIAVVGGGRNKHLSHGLNDALGRSFASVHASLGRSKSRVLHAGERKEAVPTRWPRPRFVPELGFEVYAHGGVFAGTRVDRGTELLLSALDKWRAPTEGALLDFGCGSGILARWLIDHYPQRSVLATDVSAAAVASARRTLADTTVRVERRDGLSDLEPSSIGAIVSNPPFHVGAAKDSGPTIEMIKNASRVLRTGGELIMVYNSHLPYLQRLQRIGSTKIIARDRNYLVTRSVKGRSAGR